jgi:hypothetical protein
MSESASSHAEYSPYIARPYMLCEPVGPYPYEVGEGYSILIFKGGLGIIRPTEEKELRAAQEHADLQAAMEASRTGRDKSQCPAVQLGELPPLCVQEIEPYESIWTRGVVKSLAEDYDPVGRKVHVLTIEEAKEEQLGKHEAIAFRPGAIIKAWCFPEESSLHVLEVDGQATEGIDPALDLNLEPKTNYYGNRFSAPSA